MGTKGVVRMAGCSPPPPAMVTKGVVCMTGVGLQVPPSLWVPWWQPAPNTSGSSCSGTHSCTYTATNVAERESSTFWKLSLKSQKISFEQISLGVRIVFKAWHAHFFPRRLIFPTVMIALSPFFFFFFCPRVVGFVINWLVWFIDPHGHTRDLCRSSRGYTLPLLIRPDTLARGSCFAHAVPKNRAM